jgi:hypothetical protein
VPIGVASTNGACRQPGFRMNADHKGSAFGTKRAARARLSPSALFFRHRCQLLPALNHVSGLAHVLSICGHISASFAVFPWLRHGTEDGTADRGVDASKG